MFARYSAVKKVLEEKLRTYPLDDAQSAAIQTASMHIKQYLSTYHGLVLRHIIASLSGYLMAAALQHPLGAITGYLFTRHAIFLENISEWLGLTPESLPYTNSGFCADLIDDINQSQSVAEIIEKLNATSQAVKKEIEVYNSTSSNIAAPLCAALGYWIGGTSSVRNLFAYHWPAKKLVTQALCTGIMSGLGIGVGYAVEGVKPRLPQIERR